MFNQQDLDLEGFIGEAFVLSPAQSAGPEAAPGAGAPLLLASLPDAPKIRVIVRKRPLNKKVGRSLLAKAAHSLHTHEGIEAGHECDMLPPPQPLQELERGETDVLECDATASCLYVNEPKVKVDLTKYVERHTFR